ncbi:MAG: VWA domain-containing protein [Clostridia bacterium]
MKKIITALLAFVMLVSSTVSFAANEMFFYKDETKVYFNNEFVDILDGEGIAPTVKDGVFYVPIRPFVELKNGYITWKVNGEKLQADFAVGSYYTIQDNSNEIVEYTGVNETLSAEVFLNTNYNRLMVPADTFEKLGYKIIQGDDYLGIFSISKHEDVQAIAFDRNSTISEATVKYTLLNDKGDVFIRDLSNTGDIVNTVVGGLGASIDITVNNGSVDSATISFAYDESKLGTTNESDLKIVWYNEILGRMELLENSVVDTNNNVVLVQSSHFSKYSVVDSKQWYAAWAETQLIKRDDTKGNGLFNVNLVLDTSGSMNGSVALLKETVIKFIDGLNDNDIINVITFSNGAETLIDSNSKSNSNYENIINRISANGGTDMISGLNEVLYGNILIEPVNPTEEEKLQYEQHKQIQDLKNNATTVTILLSDGVPDSDNNTDDIISSCKTIALRGKFISVALGSGSHSALMEKIAKETNGLYKYISDSNGLLEMFMQISGEVIGLEQDTDGDGIPDLIETTGMRDQAGNIFTTDPNKADTDGDMLSDGDEMGVFVNENGGYFIRESNPNIFTTFQSIAQLGDNSIDALFSDYNGNFKIKLNMNVLSEKIMEKTVFSSSGNAVNHSAMETLYASVQNLKISFSKLPDCIENPQLAPYQVAVAESGHSYNYIVVAKCKNGGVNCKNNHTIEITISGDNLDPVVVKQDVDLNQIMLEQARKDVSSIQTEISNQTKRKATEYVTSENTKVYNSSNELLNSINLIQTNIPNDAQIAIKNVIMNLVAEKKGLEKISINPSQQIKDCAELIGMVNDETFYPVINGVQYEVHITGSFIPKINLFSLPYINGTCNVKNKPNEKYSFSYIPTDRDEVNKFLDAYNKALDDSKQEAIEEIDKQGKAAIKSILNETFKAWGVTEIMNKLEADALKEVGIYEEVQMYKTGLDLLEKVSSTEGFSPKDAVDTCKEYKDYGTKSSIISDWATDKITDLIKFLSK